MSDSDLDVEGKASSVAFVLSIVALTWYVFILSLGLIGWWNARKRYRLRPRSPLSSAPASAVPGVSVLRPLKGLDANLYENLESTFTQEYPNYEIFFTVEDEYDQALGVVRDLIAKYPNVKAEVIIGEEVVGVNPKVNNLIKAYRQASHDILWVIDSNVMVAPGTLARSVDALDGPPSATQSSRRRIALVHHVPFAFATERTIGSRLEEAFLNTNHAKMYIALNSVAVDSCVVGKSNLYRKSDIDRVDGTLKPATASNRDYPHGKGFAAFGRFLAEDNMIAGALWHELDLRHDLSCDVAKNAVGNMSLSDYFWRRVRWIRVRKHMVLVATLLEPFTESVLVGILASFALRHLFGFPIWLFICLHFALWLSIDLDVYASLAGHPLPPGADWWMFVGAWLMREFLAFPIWVFAMGGSVVSWRGNRYIVVKTGEVKKIGPDTESSGWFNWGSWRRKTNDNYERLQTID
ncbi:Ceramide glucosyltransferase [Abortiporus biennis]